MAATKKSTKRKAGKKRSSAKRVSGKKRKVRRTPKKSSDLRRRAKKGLRVARSGIDTVREAGDKAWTALKSTTSQVVGGVKDRFAEETRRKPNYRD
jgi:hypothetical protein